MSGNFWFPSLAEESLLQLRGYPAEELSDLFSWGSLLMSLLFISSCSLENLAGIQLGVCRGRLGEPQCETVRSSSASTPALLCTDGPCAKTPLLYLTKG